MWLFIFAIIFLIVCLIVLVVGVISAPEGYEEDEGFYRIPK